MQTINSLTNPFPGLRPFESSETHLFFGRDGQSEELLRRLKRTRFLAVVGTSGSGKSSLVRAGLLPALQGGLMASAGSDWRIAILRPGGDPIGNLASALAASNVLGSGDEKSALMQSALAETTLRRSSLGLVELVRRARTKLDGNGQPLFPDYENLLVVVDQFEELFRFKQLIEEENSQEDAAAFVKLLLEAIGQKDGKIYVVLTMRSDFLGDCAQFRELPEAINNGQYLIPRMTRDERREAITGPVAVGQGTITEPLVNQLLNDVGDNPDQLPILQHALMRTWDYWLGHRSNGEPIDLPDYNAIGGMTEALSRHADEAYAELSDEQQAIAEKLFKGLTEKGTDNREIRRPMELHEICKVTGAGEAAVIAVIEVFRRKGRSFLMPPPTDALTGASVHLNAESLIDISHESLIRNWTRLKTWVDEESRSARIYRRLAETAVLHREGGAGLLRDPELQIALVWREESQPNAVWAQRYHTEFAPAMEFLDQSVAARDAQLASEESHRRREITRTRLTALIFGLAFLFSMGMGVFAYGRKVAAESAKRTAETAQKTAEVALADALQQRRIAEKAQQDTNAALKALQIKRAALADANEQMLHAREAADKRAEEAKKSAKEAKESADAAEIARLMAVKAKDEAKANAEDAHQKELIAMAASKEAIKQIGENRKLLYSSNIGIAQQVLEDNNDERARQLLDNQRYDPSKNFQIRVSDIMLTEDTGDLRGFEWYYLWRLANRKLATLNTSDGTATKAAAPQTTSPGVAKPSTVAAYSEGTWFIGGSDKSLRLWNINSNRPAEILPAYAEPVTSVAFSDLGSLLAVAGRDSVEVRSYFYSRNSSIIPDELRHTIKLKSVTDRTVITFSPDGKYLAAGNGGTFVLWDSEGKQDFTLAQGSGESASVFFIEDGKTLVTGDGKKLMRWDVATRKSVPIELLRSSDYEPLLKSVAISRDGKYIVTASDSTFELWTAEKDEPAKYSLTTDWPAHKEPEDSYSTSHYNLIVAISPDGKLLATADGTDVKNNGGVKVWELKSAGRKAPLTLNPEIEPTSLAFTDDSKSLAVGAPGGVQLWDVSERKPFHSLANLSSAGMLVFAPDGTSFVNVYGDEMTLWLTEPLEKVKPYGEPPFKAEIDLSTETDGLAIKDPPLAISPNSRMLATRRDDVLKLWNINPRGLRATIKGDVGGKAAFSPDGKTLATASHVDSVEWWNTETDQTRTPGTLTNPGRVSTIAFSPDGNLLAVGGGSNKSKSGLVTLWDTKTHRLLKTFEGHVGVRIEVRAVAFSPDSKTLATAGTDNILVLWNVSPGGDFGRYIATLEGHRSPVTTVAYSPDGKTIASGDNCGITNVWSATSHQWLLTLDAHPDKPCTVSFANTQNTDDVDLNASPNAILSLAFSASGDTLFTSDKAGGIWLWPAVPRERVDEPPQKISLAAPFFELNKLFRLGSNGAQSAFFSSGSEMKSESRANEEWRAERRDRRAPDFVTLVEKILGSDEGFQLAR
jgi:WD40 repeat protein/energy-coupling factor transporter ATP-binding protein EcfA2